MQKPSLKKISQTCAQLLFRKCYTLTFDQLDFQLCNLPLRKRLNLLIQGAQLLMRSVRRIGFPPILQIEPTNMCNLRCLTCATGTELMRRPEALMSFEMYRNIIDQVKNYVCLLVFWSWGEPFINKDAFRMIRYAKDRGILVHTSTNGHFFATKERARQVIESGLDSLIVAADGLDQPTYERYRKGGNLNLVIKSIENLVAERTLAGAKHPLITFRFIVMKHNEHQVNQVKGFAERLGVDVVTFRSAVIERNEVNLEDELSPVSEEFQQYDYKGTPIKEHRITQHRSYCHRPYANLMVFSNGDVVSCENDFNATVPFGNVTEKSLHEILSSARSRSFLKAFRYDLDQFSFCRTCEVRDIKHHTANIKTYILNKELYNYAKDV
jgi:radical SAM protein with 4Fe4S-binding SPASM domain